MLPLVAAAITIAGFQGKLQGDSLILLKMDSLFNFILLFLIDKHRID